MKIKEVIEKTGLTDRAIRLYIDEGLAVPSIAESYSGRKSIEFSESDVERLKNIALLRKAGFSIAEIKSLVDDESAAKEIIENFIVKTEKNIAEETEILERLKNISFDEDVTIETICEALSVTVEKNAVPNEDMKSGTVYNATRKFAFGFGIFGIVFSVCAMIAFVIFSKICFVHLYLKDDFIGNFLFANCGCVLILILSAVIALLNKKTEHRKKIEKIKTGISGVLAIVLFPVAILSSLPYFLGIGLCYSLTYDVEDYLVLDKWIQDDYGEEIDEVFPDEIPRSALESADRNFDVGYPLTTKYYYKHTFVLDPDFDIVAEWILPEEEYENEKNRLNGKEICSLNKGDWTLLVFKCEHNPFPSFADLITVEERIFWGESWSHDGYWISFFAYNDKTRRVRYVASYAIDSYPEGPYYLSLDW